jgi:hypothetical protein
MCGFKGVLLFPAAQPCEVRTSRDPGGEGCARGLPLSDTAYTSAFMPAVCARAACGAGREPRQAHWRESRAARAGRITGGGQIFWPALEQQEFNWVLHLGLVNPDLEAVRRGGRPGTPPRPQRRAALLRRHCEGLEQQAGWHVRVGRLNVRGGGRLHQRKPGVLLPHLVSEEWRLSTNLYLF